jgi:hypothetical protein
MQFTTFYRAPEILVFIYNYVLDSFINKNPEYTIVPEFRKKMEAPYFI